MLGFATYDFTDDKIRIYFFERVDKEIWQEFKDAGFTWTMKQESDLSAVWRPGREDLAIKYCGNLQAEESTFADRSADRAERFDGYLENRIADTEKNLDNVDAIGMQDRLKAERRAKKINRMRERASDNFEKAKYWHSRIEGVIGHALYKEDEGVRKRRIRTLKTDLNKQKKEIDFYKMKLEKYSNMTQDEINGLNFRDGQPLKEDLIKTLEARLTNGHAKRWLDHLTFRVEFEEKMLAEAGYKKLEADYKIGGLANGLEIVRINKHKGEINSLTVKNPKFVKGNWSTPECKLLIEDVTEYLPPVGKVEKKKTPPLLNLSPKKIKEIFGGVEVISITEAECKEQRFYVNPVKDGKFISRYEVKMQGAECDFRIRGWSNYNNSVVKVVSLKDKKFQDEKCTVCIN